MSGRLASILIPAYNERHFAAAFASAREQSYPDLEIVVCDDSPGKAIGEIVAAAADSRVRYERNPRNLGFGANFSRCLELSRGDYVKFLNDDDLLRPQCVATFAAALARDPKVTLATSRRTMIDDAGQARPDVPATQPLSYVSGVMPGFELGDLVLVNSINFIGEPTTAMFRRADLVAEDGAIFRWEGRDYHCLADIALWLRLLARGNAYYHADPLSHFRFHGGQEQQKAEVTLLCVLERLWILGSARRAGFLAAQAAWRAALTQVASIAKMYADARQVPPGSEARFDQWRRELEGELTAAGVAKTL